MREGRWGQTYHDGVAGAQILISDHTRAGTEFWPRALDPSSICMYIYNSNTRTTARVGVVLVNKSNRKTKLGGVLNTINCVWAIIFLQIQMAACLCCVLAVKYPSISHSHSPCRFHSHLQILSSEVPIDHSRSGAAREACKPNRSPIWLSIPYVAL